MGVWSSLLKGEESIAAAERGASRGAEAMNAAGRTAKTAGKIGLGYEALSALSKMLGSSQNNQSGTDSNSGPSGGTTSGVTGGGTQSLIGIASGVKRIDETPFRASFQSGMTQKLDSIDKNIVRLGNISIAIKQTLDLQIMMQKRSFEIAQTNAQESSLKYRNQQSSNIFGGKSNLTSGSNGILAGLGLLAAGMYLNGGGGRPDNRINGPRPTVSSTSQGGFLGGGLMDVTIDKFFNNLAETAKLTTKSVAAAFEKRTERIVGAIEKWVPNTRPGSPVARMKIKEDLIVEKPSMFMEGLTKIGKGTVSGFRSVVGGVRNMASEVSSSGVSAITKGAMSAIRSTASNIKNSEVLRTVVNYIRRFKNPSAIAEAASSAMKAAKSAVKVKNIKNLKVGFLGKFASLMIIIDRLAPVVLENGSAPSDKVYKDFCIAVGQAVGLIGAMLLTEVNVAAFVTGGAEFGAAIGTLICPVVGTIIGGVVGGVIGFAGAQILDTIIAWLASEVGGDLGAFFYDLTKKGGSITSALAGLATRLGRAALNVASQVVAGKAGQKLAEYSGWNFVKGIFGFGKSKDAAAQNATPTNIPPVTTQPNTAGTNLAGASFAAGGGAGVAINNYEKLAKGLDFNKKFKDLSKQEQDRYLQAMADSEGRNANNVNHRNNNPGNILWSSADEKLLRKYGGTPGEKRNRLQYARFPSWQQGWECAREKLKSGRYENLSLAQDAVLWTTGSLNGSAPQFPAGTSVDSQVASNSSQSGRNSFIRTMPHGLTPNAGANSVGIGQSGLGKFGGAASTGGKPKLAPIKTKSGRSVMVGEAYAKNFQGFINDLEATGYKITSLGGYADRQNVNAPGVKSYHALGAAIDINPASNPNKSTRTDLPPITGQLAAKWGLGWGMNWKRVKDPMHFSIAKHEQGSIDISTSGVAPGEVSGAHGAAQSGGQVTPSFKSLARGFDTPDASRSKSSSSASFKSPGSAPTGLTPDAPGTGLPQRYPAKMTAPTPKTQNQSLQYGVPDPKCKENRSDDYTVFFNANEPGIFGLLHHII